MNKEKQKKLIKKIIIHSFALVASVTLQLMLSDENIS